MRLFDQGGGARHVGRRHGGARYLAVAQVARLAGGCFVVALGHDIDAGCGDVGLEYVADAGAATAEAGDAVGDVAGLEGDRVYLEAGVGNQL